KVVVRDRGGVSTATPLATRPTPSMVACPPSKTAVRDARSPTKRSVDAAVNVGESPAAGAGAGEPYPLPQAIAEQSRPTTGANGEIRSTRIICSTSRARHRAIG